MTPAGNGSRSKNRKLRLKVSFRRYPAVSASMNEGPDHIQQQTLAGVQWNYSQWVKKGLSPNSWSCPAS